MSTTTNNKDDRRDGNGEHGDGDGDSDVFRRRSRILRSPTGAPTQSAENRCRGARFEAAGGTVPKRPSVADNISEGSVSVGAAEARGTPRGFTGTQPQQFQGGDIGFTPTTSSTAGSTNQTGGQRSSPNQEFISRMRTEEEAAIGDIKRALVKIRAAMQRQRNVSMDVREGIQQIDELVSIAETCRANWVRIENTKRRDMETKCTTENVQENAGTPKTGNNKRTASSPTEVSSVTKRPCDREHGGWQTVEARKKPVREVRRKKDEKTGTQQVQQIPTQQVKQRPKNGDTTRKAENSRLPRKKAEAIIAKPCDGYSYADMLRTLRERAGTVENSKVKTIRKTKTGSLILELEKGEQINSDLLLNIKEILKEAAEIKSVTPKTTFEIRDLDSFTTPDEVERSIRGILRKENESINVRISKPNSRELVRAFVTVSQGIAGELLKLEYIQVGWCRVKLRRYEDTKRCFRCFGIGHEQWNCKGPDRKSQGLCIRCGVAGHLIKECKNEPKCYLCEEAGHQQTRHLAGSRKCCVTTKGPK